MEFIYLENCTGFDWDKGNSLKSLEKYNVTLLESEEIFFNKPLLLENDTQHSTTKEKRYFALGITNKGRKLFCAFIIRKQKIRVISCRDMHKKERGFYEKDSKI